MDIMSTNATTTTGALEVVISYDSYVNQSPGRGVYSGGIPFASPFVIGGTLRVPPAIFFKYL
jgi:hypothetical protein